MNVLGLFKEASVPGVLGGDIMPRIALLPREEEKGNNELVVHLQEANRHQSHRAQFLRSLNWADRALA